MAASDLDQLAPQPASTGSPGSAQGGRNPPSPNDARWHSDNFMLHGFKILMCKKKSYHEWKQCPFAHPGEKARRRPGRSFPAMCPDANAPAGCPRGDACSNAHSLFELYLHPDRYRTEWCNNGEHCTRRWCWFAHNASQLRSPGGLQASRSLDAPASSAAEGAIARLGSISSSSSTSSDRTASVNPAACSSGVAAASFAAGSMCGSPGGGVTSPVMHTQLVFGGSAAAAAAPCSQPPQLSALCGSHDQAASLQLLSHYQQLLLLQQQQQQGLADWAWLELLLSAAQQPQSGAAACTGLLQPGLMVNAADQQAAWQGGHHGHAHWQQLHTAAPGTNAWSGLGLGSAAGAATSAPPGVHWGAPPGSSSWQADGLAGGLRLLPQQQPAPPRSASMRTTDVSDITRALQRQDLSYLSSGL